jgi:hypothetical protein
MIIESTHFSNDDDRYYGAPEDASSLHGIDLSLRKTLPLFHNHGDQSVDRGGDGATPTLCDDQESVGTLNNPLDDDSSHNSSTTVDFLDENDDPLDPDLLDQLLLLSTPPEQNATDESLAAAQSTNTISEFENLSELLPNGRSFKFHPHDTKLLHIIKDFPSRNNYPRRDPNPLP